jgi:hypothetical protein
MRAVPSRAQRGYSFHANLVACGCHTANKLGVDLPAFSHALDR